MTQWLSDDLFLVLFFVCFGYFGDPCQELFVWGKGMGPLFSIKQLLDKGKCWQVELPILFSKLFVFALWTIVSEVCLFSQIRKTEWNNLAMFLVSVERYASILNLSNEKCLFMCSYLIGLILLCLWTNCLLAWFFGETFNYLISTLRISPVFCPFSSLKLDWSPSLTNRLSGPARRRKHLVGFRGSSVCPRHILLLL